MTTQKDLVYYAVLIILIIVGWFISKYSGGIVTGFGLAMLLASILGKALAKKTVARIDKQVKDVLTNDR